MLLTLFLDQTSDLQLRQQLCDVEAQLASQENKNQALSNERDLLAKYLSATTLTCFFSVSTNW